MSNVFLFLFAYRLVSALTSATFFQPDEYYQALEPAIAFLSSGETHNGAYITWEWHAALRSPLLPAVFASVYRAVDILRELLKLEDQAYAQVYLAAPKILQAFIAAVGDYAVYKLARRLYGQTSLEARWTLLIQVVSPWLWFTATRTLANCTETTLTALALLYWPWQTRPQENEKGKKSSTNFCELDADSQTALSWSLTLAAVACILRPTNILLWVPLGFGLLQSLRRDDRVRVLSSAVLFGGTTLALSLALERAYFGIWAFTPLRFLHFNIAKNLSVFYGTSPWHYYLSQGLPLLLTTALPFALLGIYKSLHTGPTVGRSFEAHLSWTILFVIIAMSVISHKEIRFIYPLIPALHLLAASYIRHSFYPPMPASSMPLTEVWRPLSGKAKSLFFFLFSINVLIAYYTSQVHQRGPLDVVSFLRSSHLSHERRFESIVFLMPCHSVPWRSHLVFSSLQARALTCEPPIALEPGSKERQEYLDEADIFFIDPIAFLVKYMPKQIPVDRYQLESVRNRRIFSKFKTEQSTFIDIQESESKYWPLRSGEIVQADTKGNHNAYSIADADETVDWPDYLVFFSDFLEPILQPNIRGGYKECWRGFNSHAHDDWRRKGEIVVWCLE
jgi:phosphatidylinositol glycan class B